MSRKHKRKRCRRRVPRQDRGCGNKKELAAWALGRPEMESMHSMNCKKPNSQGAEGWEAVGVDAEWGGM